MTTLYTRPGLALNCSHGTYPLWKQRHPDPKAWNKDLKVISPAFQALLDYSSPDTQHTLMRQTRSTYSIGRTATWFFFVGSDDTLKFSFDLTNQKWIDRPTKI